MPLHQKIDLMAGKRLLVIGDLILDRYVWGDVTRISQEAPVPVVEVTDETVRVGGAANVAHNAASLDATVEVIGVVGSEANGKYLLDLLQKYNIDTVGVYVDEERPTSTKTRIIATNQQIVRVDRESKLPVYGSTQEQLLAMALNKLPDVDAVIFADYDKGVVTNQLIQAITPVAKRSQIPVVVDPKVENFWNYKGVTTITPNQKEAGTAIGSMITDQATLVAAGEEILDRLGLDHLLITRGEHGMALFQRLPLDHDREMSSGELQVCQIETQVQEVFDVTGAGDTVVAVFTLALATGLTPFDSAQVANIAGGIVVGEVGCVTVGKNRLRLALQRAGL